MKHNGLLRVKLLLAEYGPQIVVGCALLGVVLLGVAGWTYTNPPTTEVTDHTHEQTVRSTLHTQATATGNTSLYRSGQELTDQPAYLFATAPALTLTLRTAVPANRSVEVDQEMTLRYQVTRGGDAFWRESRLLLSNETTTSTGEVATNTTLDATSLRSRLTEIRSEVTDVGTLRAVLLVRVTYETDRYAGTLTETVPVTLADDWYAVRSEPLERTHSTPQTHRVVLPTRSTSAYAVPGGVGLVSLGVAVAVAFRLRQGMDAARLRREVERHRYDEWISTGSVANVPSGATIYVDSLSGLVDVAIDTGTRVVHDEATDTYVVVTDSVVYYHNTDGFLSLNAEN